MLTRTIQHTTHIHIHTHVHSTCTYILGLYIIQHTYTYIRTYIPEHGAHTRRLTRVFSLHSNYAYRLYIHIHTYIHTCMHTYEHRARTRSLAWEFTLLPQPSKSRTAPWALNRCSEAALATSRTAALGLCILSSCSSAERVRRSAPNFLAGFAGLPCVASSSAEAWEHELLMRGSA